MRVGDPQAWRTSGELSALPAAGLAVRLAGAYRLIAELTGQVERLTALNERLSARVDELERRARQDSCRRSRRPPTARIRRKREGEEEHGSVAAGAGEAAAG